MLTMQSASQARVPNEVIGLKLKQEQLLEKLAWKGLLITKIICERGLRTTG